MSEKYEIEGPDGEVIGVHFQNISQNMLMIGGKSKFLPFIQHICFKTMAFKKHQVYDEYTRQAHKYRYYFKISEKRFRAKWYRVQEKYTTKKLKSIIKIT